MFPFAASGEPDERKPVVSDSIFFLPVPVGTGLETPAAAARAWRALPEEPEEVDSGAFSITNARLFRTGGPSSNVQFFLVCLFDERC